MAGNKGIIPVSFYRFSATNRTITFSNDYAGLDLAEITYITNIKNGVATVIYDPFDATKGGTLSGLTLTLAFDTTTMADTDPLQIIVGFTPVNADPLPVKLVEGPDEKDDTDLLNRIADGIDFLNLSLDESEGIQVNTRDVSIKKDSQGAIVNSDSPDLIRGPILRAVNDSFIVNTTGYNTAVFQITGNSNSNLSIQVESSLDGANWISIPYTAGSQNQSAAYTQAGTTIFISTNTIYLISCHPIAKLVRVRVQFYTAGAASGFCQLRNILYGTHGVLGAAHNISGINGSSPLNAQSYLNNASITNLAGTLSVAGAYAPSLTPPNSNPTVQPPPYPISIGGVEQPFIGQLAGVFRYIMTDPRGRTMLGTDTAFRTPNMGGPLEQSQAGTSRGVGGIPNNIVGAQSLTVTNVAQDFGDTQVMLLRQILTELKILNQQFAEMPFLLNQANFTISDPQEYRNDGDFDSSIQ